MASQSRGRGPLSIFQNLLLMLFGVAMGIFVFEFVARALYREPWVNRLVTEQRISERLDYGDRGIHRRGYSKIKSAQTRRVLILGDSFTYGLGVFEESKIFPKILERSLNDGIEGVGSVEVGNGGLPGRHTRSWLGLMNRHRKSFQPDVVVMVFFLRDGAKIRVVDTFFNPIREEIVERNQSSEWYQQVYLYRLAQDYIDRQKVAKEYTRALVEAYTGGEEQTAEWEAAKRNIKEIVRLAEEESAVAGLVIFPILVDLHRNYPFEQICDILEGFAHENAIPVHNMLPDFLGHDASTLWVSAYDQHPNAEGHRIAAESMLPFVRALLRNSEEMSRSSAP